MSVNHFENRKERRSKSNNCKMIVITRIKKLRRNKEWKVKNQILRFLESTFPTQTLILYDIIYIYVIILELFLV